MVFPGTASNASFFATFPALPFVPGRISKSGSKSTIVFASFARIVMSPSTFAVPSLIWASSGLDAHHRLLQIRAVDRQAQVGLLGQEPGQVGERRVVQLDHELLAVVRRDQVHGELHPLGLAAVHADAQEVEEQLGRHRADDVRTTGLGRGALGDAGAQLVGPGQEAVAQPRVLLLVADLLEDIGQQVLGWLVVRLGLYQLVENFLGQQVLAFVVKLLAAGENLRRSAHHFDVQGGRVAGRQRNERRGVAVPETQVAIDHAPAVVLHRSVVSAALPLLLQALRQIIHVVDLVDRHTLVGQVEDLVVEVGVQVALRAQDVLHPVVAPPRPVVGGEHHFGFLADTSRAPR